VQAHVAHGAGSATSAGVNAVPDQNMACHLQLCLPSRPARRPLTAARDGPEVAMSGLRRQRQVPMSSRFHLLTASLGDNNV